MDPADDSVGEVKPVCEDAAIQHSEPPLGKVATTQVRRAATQRLRRADTCPRGPDASEQKLRVLANRPSGWQGLLGLGELVFVECWQGRSSVARAHAIRTPRRTVTAEPSATNAVSGLTDSEATNSAP